MHRAGVIPDDQVTHVLPLDLNGVLIANGVFVQSVKQCVGLFGG